MYSSEKINIYVPQEDASVLMNDALNFEVFKKDGVSINWNQLITRILIGYYDSYNDERSKLYKTIINQLEQTKLDTSICLETARNIVKSLIMYKGKKKRGQHSVKLSMKPTKQIESLLFRIQNDIDVDESISHVLCSILHSYCNMSISERERIVYKEQYELIDQMIKEKRQITFTTTRDKTILHNAIPYKISVGKEGLYNYVLCEEYDNYRAANTAISYRLCHISNIARGDTSRDIDDSIKKRLDLMCEYGPQFSINSNAEICVKMTNRGVDLYKRIYYGRPNYMYKENVGDDILYYFDCSENQAFLYFIRFSKGDAVVVYPEELRQRIVDFHKDALNGYEE